MKRFLIVTIAGVLLATVSASAQIKKCEDLKNEIEEKLKAKNVSNFTLEIVPAEQVKDQKVVGSCEGGTKKITYTKEEAKPAK